MVNYTKFLKDAKCVLDTLADASKNSNTFVKSLDNTSRPIN